MTNSNAHITLNDLIRLGVNVKVHLSHPEKGKGIADPNDGSPLDEDTQSVEQVAMDVAVEAIKAGTGEEDWDGWQVQIELPDGSIFAEVTFEELGVA